MKPKKTIKKPDEQVSPAIEARMTTAENIRGTPYSPIGAAFKVTLRRRGGSPGLQVAYVTAANQAEAITRAETEYGLGWVASEAEPTTQPYLP